MSNRGISLAAFKDDRDIVEVIRRFPECKFELSYDLPGERLDDLIPLLKGRIASVHSLCPRREYFPNFATSDRETLAWSEMELLKDADLASSLGASYMVLHPGYLADTLVPSDAEKRIHMMETEFSRYVLPGTRSIAGPEYIHTPEYRKAFEEMAVNIESISKEIGKKGVTLAIENLNPRSGYILIHPDEIIELETIEDIHFTVDIGHLWITTELYDMDFLSSLERILSTGKVVTTHLHSNITNGSQMIFEDSHQSLDRNDLPWKDAINMIKASGANMIIESKEDSIHNLELLFQN